jgi:leucyl aminopeptidase (aminopeptidase T)
MEIDSELLQGARNAIRVCMNVSASDRVFITTDDETLEVGKALEIEARAVQAEVECVRLEEFGQRPLTRLPDELAHRFAAFSPSVTFFAASAKEGELPMRGGFFTLHREGKTRHAHMPTITAQVMREGMRADYHQIHQLTMSVFELVRYAKSIHVTAPEGTDFSACFDEKLKWVPLGGLYPKAGEWGNLPEGEVFTCPATVEGVVVAREIGDYFAAKYGVLSQPMTIEIESGFVRQVKSKQKELETEFIAYLDAAENGRRVGEFAIGTNIGISALCGVFLQDEKFPGVHIAFGNPFGDLTGANWSSKNHVDVIPPQSSIEVDGKLLMRDGRFTLPNYSIGA